MRIQHNSRVKSLMRLVLDNFNAPPGALRVSIALIYGILCHTAFVFAVMAMITAMYFGMSKSLGAIPHPWSIMANLFLLIQFPIMHSVLLSRRGSQFLIKLAPFGYGKTLATTTFALIASVQLAALFILWTPSEIIWWQAEGSQFAAILTLYAASWLLLVWASFDAGPEVQSGALGWMSLVQRIKPVFPDMPTQGLYKVIRQPIYLAFALTTWTVPVWTPDQLCLAIVLTIYCLSAPLLKEKRFSLRFGKRFTSYQTSVPYMLPRMLFASRGKCIIDKDLNK